MPLTTFESKHSPDIVFTLVSRWICSGYNFSLHNLVRFRNVTHFCTLRQVFLVSQQSQSFFPVLFMFANSSIPLALVILSSTCHIPLGPTLSALTSHLFIRPSLLLSSFLIPFFLTCSYFYSFPSWILSAAWGVSLFRAVLSSVSERKVAAALGFWKPNFGT